MSIAVGFEFYSLTLGESTDIKDTAEVAIFVRGSIKGLVSPKS